MGQYCISYSASWPKVAKEVARYNQAHKIGIKTDGTPKLDLKKALRPMHELCLKEIVRAFSGQLARYNTIQINPNNLPPLYTNRSYLAKRLNTCPKTVYNLIQRLIDSGLITAKASRGWQNDFTLHIDPSVLELRQAVVSTGGRTDTPAQVRGVMPGTANVWSGASMRAERTSATDASVPHFQQAENNNLNGNSLPPSFETVFSKNEVNLPVVIVEKETGDDHSAKETGDTPSQKGVAEGSGQRNARQSGTGAPMVADRREVGELLKTGENAPQGQKYQDYRARLVALAIAHMFDQLEFMAESQMQVIDTWIEDQFCKVHPDQYDELYQRLSIRMMLAGDWRRRKRKGKTESPDRYIPIPSTCFAPGGWFEMTEKWLDSVKMTNKTVETYKARYQAVMREFGAFCNAVANFRKHPDVPTYSQTRQRLAERYFALDRAFDYIVAPI